MAKHDFTAEFEKALALEGSDYALSFARDEAHNTGRTLFVRLGHPVDNLEIRGDDELDELAKRYASLSGQTALVKAVEEDADEFDEPEGDSGRGDGEEHY